MSQPTENEGIRAIEQDEHNGDAHAKRVILRYQDTSSGDWVNFTPDKVAGVDFDYLDVQQTSATVETYVFKTGGSGGTTVLTVTVTYTSSAKSDIDTVVWS